MGTQHADGHNSGGAAAVTPQESQQDWPGVFTTTDPGGVITWTWEAPDGSDQSAHQVAGAGDLADYAVNGKHIITGLGATGEVLALHEIMLGDPSAVIPGAMRLPPWDTLTKHDPNNTIDTITADSVRLHTFFNSATAGWARLYAALSIPQGKQVRAYWLETPTGGGWNDAGWSAGAFFSDSPTNPAAAGTHADMLVYANWTPHGGKCGMSLKGAVVSKSNVNDPQHGVVGSTCGGEDGKIITIVAAPLSGAGTANSGVQAKLLGGSTLALLSDVTHFGFVVGFEFAAIPAYVVKGEVLLVVS